MTTSNYDRFSQLYAERGSLAQDSIKARRRCGAELGEIQQHAWDGQNLTDRIGRRLDTELGASLLRPTYAYTIAGYWGKCTVEEFLDSLTLVVRCIPDNSTYKHWRAGWIAFVDRVFREENLCYQMRADGVVHYRHDVEYEGNVSALIGALQESKYKAVRDAFERARADLAKETPDRLDAVRSLFEAAESLFKIVTNTNASLDDGEVKRSLAAFVDRKMAAHDQVAKGAAARFTAGFADWVNACHPYRHGHKQENAPVPPIELAVALMSSGAAYIRWLATLDQ